MNEEKLTRAQRYYRRKKEEDPEWYEKRKKQSKEYSASEIGKFKKKMNMRRYRAEQKAERELQQRRDRGEIYEPYKR